MTMDDVRTSIHLDTMTVVIADEDVMKKMRKKTENSMKTSLREKFCRLTESIRKAKVIDWGKEQKNESSNRCNMKQEEEKYDAHIFSTSQQFFFSLPLSLSAHRTHEYVRCYFCSFHLFTWKSWENVHSTKLLDRERKIFLPLAWQVASSNNLLW